MDNVIIIVSAIICFIVFVVLFVFAWIHFIKAGRILKKHKLSLRHFRYLHMQNATLKKVLLEEPDIKRNMIFRLLRWFCIAYPVDSVGIYCYSRQVHSRRDRTRMDAHPTKIKICANLCKSVVKSL